MALTLPPNRADRNRRINALALAVIGWWTLFVALFLIWPPLAAIVPAGLLIRWVYRHSTIIKSDRPAPPHHPSEHD